MTPRYVAVTSWQTWLRPDRHYCESQFFRARITPEGEELASAEACRIAIAKRNDTAHLQCGTFARYPSARPSPFDPPPVLSSSSLALADLCHTFCTDGLARGIKDTVKVRH